MATQSDRFGTHEIDPKDHPHLFTVRVRDAGRACWNVVIRATDEADAAARLRQRGYEILSVQPGFRAPESRLGQGLLRAVCVTCRYSLSGLERGEAGEAVCPECGTLNFPERIWERDVQLSRVRWRLLRVAVWLFAAFSLVLIVAAAAVFVYW